MSNTNWSAFLQMQKTRRRSAVNPLGTDKASKQWQLALSLDISFLNFPTLNWTSKLQKIAIMKKRLALAVNCWVLIHRFEVSCKEDQIMSS